MTNEGGDDSAPHVRSQRRDSIAQEAEAARQLAHVSRNEDRQIKWANEREEESWTEPRESNEQGRREGGNGERGMRGRGERT